MICNSYKIVKIWIVKIKKWNISQPIILHNLKLSLTGIILQIK